MHSATVSLVLYYLKALINVRKDFLMDLARKTEKFIWGFRLENYVGLARLC